MTIAHLTQSIVVVAIFLIPAELAGAAPIFTNEPALEKVGQLSAACISSTTAQLDCATNGVSDRGLRPAHLNPEWYTIQYED